MESYAQCVRLAREMGDRAMTGHALSLEGRARQKTGDGPGAIDCWLEAVPLLAAARGPGREILEWMQELKKDMGEEPYYEAIVASEGRRGDPLLRGMSKRQRAKSAKKAGAKPEDLEALLRGE